MNSSHREPESDPAAVPVRPDETIGARPHTVWQSPPGRALAGMIRRTRDWIAADVVLAVMLLTSVVVLWFVTWGSGELYRGLKDVHGLVQLDQPVLDWVRSIRTPAANAAVTAFTDIGGAAAQPYLLTPVALFLAWRWRSFTPPILCVIAATGAGILTTFGKELVGRARPPFEAAVPPYELSPAFPSGHTLTAVVVAGIICYLLLHWFTTAAARVACVTIAVIYALAMGLSRVYLGHHWLTDVAVGWLVGLGWLTVVVTLHRLWLTARRKHGEQRFGVLPKGHTPER